MTGMNSGLHFSRTPAKITDYSPFLGEHNEDLLEDLLGLDHDTVKKLTESGVLYQDSRSSAARSGS